MSSDNFMITEADLLKVEQIRGIADLNSADAMCFTAGEVRTLLAHIDILVEILRRVRDTSLWKDRIARAEVYDEVYAAIGDD